MTGVTVHDEIIAVTGGSGFVGSHVVDALLGAGRDVRVLDRQTAAAATTSSGPKSTCSTRSRSPTRSKACGPVFHLAAMADVNDIVADPAESVALNTLGVARVLEAARASRCRSRDPVEHRVGVRGDARRRGRRGHAVRPHTDRHLYVSQKIAAEMFCRDYAHSLRPSVHRVALRHSLRAADAQRPRGRRVLAASDARRTVAHRRRRFTGAPLRVRRGPGGRARARTLEARGREPHLQPRVERGDLDPHARGDGRRARRRRRGDVRSRRVRATTRPRRGQQRSGARRARMGSRGTRSRTGSERRSSGTASNDPSEA